MWRTQYKITIDSLTYDAIEIKIVIDMLESIDVDMTMSTSVKNVKDLLITSQ